jgi:hypothetical protein
MMSYLSLVDRETQAKKKKKPLKYLRFIAPDVMESENAPDPSESSVVLGASVTQLTFNGYLLNGA